MKPEEIRAGRSLHTAYQILGKCDRQVWGRDVSELLERVLLRAGLEPLQPESDAFPKDGHIAIFRVDYFFDRWAGKDPAGVSDGLKICLWWSKTVPIDDCSIT